jgi:hypothetical protein
VRRRGLLLGAARLGTVGLVALLAAVVAGSAQARPGSCLRSHPLPPGSRDPDSLLLKTPEASAIVMHFGDSRSRSVSSVLVSADAGHLLPEDFTSETGLAIRLGDNYIRKDSDHWIASDDDGIAASLIPISSREMQLCVVVEPKAIGHLVPGRYKGTIFIVDAKQVQLASLPVELTFRSSRWTAVEIALVGLLLGLAVRVLSEAAASQQAARRDREPLTKRRALAKATWDDLGFWATALIALVAGWLVFDQVYDGNPVWGAGSGDVAKLVAICFIAQLSGNQGIDVIRRVAGGSGTGASA